MSTFYMLVGMPASGKSTISKKYEDMGVGAFSSDKIRGEEFGDEGAQYTEDWLKEHNYNGPDTFLDKSRFASTIIFEILFERMINELKRGKDVLLDSTNTTKYIRYLALSKLKDNADRIIAIVMAASFDECMKRNAKRERIVPEVTMRRIANNFVPPVLEEGFERIEYAGDASKIDYGIEYFIKTYSTGIRGKKTDRTALDDFIRTDNISEKYKDPEIVNKLYEISSVYKIMSEMDKDDRHHNYNLIENTFRRIQNVNEKMTDSETVFLDKVAALFEDTGKVCFRMDNIDEVRSKARTDESGKVMIDFDGFKKASAALAKAVLENADFRQEEIDYVCNKI